MMQNSVPLFWLIGLFSFYFMYFLERKWIDLQLHYPLGVPDGYCIVAGEEVIVVTCFLYSNFSFIKPVLFSIF